MFLYGETGYQHLNISAQICLFTCLDVVVSSYSIDWPGMQLSAAIVVFAASLPHAIVRNPVGPLHTEHQVLDEGNLHTENTHYTLGIWCITDNCLHTHADAHRWLIDPGLQGTNRFSHTYCTVHADIIKHDLKYRSGFTCDTFSASLQSLVKWTR